MLWWVGTAFEALSAFASRVAFRLAVLAAKWAVLSSAVMDESLLALGLGGMLDSSGVENSGKLKSLLNEKRWNESEVNGRMRTK